jgi:hypothetical protein
MHPVDMSAKAITARLKLVSELLRLCLSLGTAKVDSRREEVSSRFTNSQKRPQQTQK